MHMLLWQNGVATDLGNLGGSGKFAGNIAFAINNKGQVVGNSDLAGDVTNHGFLWQNGHITDMGTLPGDVISASLAINDSGGVVGVSVANDFSSRAVIWEDRAILDLNSLVPADSPLFFMFACSINARGEIVGQALDKATDVPRGYLLTPRTGGAPATSVSEALRNEPRPPARSDPARRLRAVRLSPASADVR